MNTEQALQKIEEPQAQSELAVVRAPITSAQAKIDAVANLTMKAYERASTLELTPEEVAALEADFPDEAFQPGAAGKEHLIYIEHAHLRDRLNQVFRPGQWAIVPRNRWAEDFTTPKGTEASRVYVEAMLCIRGCFVAEAVGDMVYYKNNDSQNYGDAVEGAKTAALRRCAKELGIGLQAWKKSWCEGWWERRRSGKRGPDPQPKTTSAATTPPADPTEAQRLKWVSMLQPLGRDALQFCYEKGWLKGPVDDQPGEPVEVLPLSCVPRTKKQAEAILAEIERRMDGEFAPATSGQPEPENTASSQPGAVLGHSGPDADGVETFVGTLTWISEKSGKSKKGQWVSFGLRMVHGDMEIWVNTFDKTTGELAKKLKDERVRVSYRAGAKGNELVAFEKIKELP